MSHARQLVTGPNPGLNPSPNPGLNPSPSRGPNPSPLLGRLLPAGVCAAESLGDQPLDAPGAELFPAEEDALRKAAPKRRRDYTLVRQCARQALGGLGLPPMPILSGPKREPLWPEGVVGSMTHCDGYRAAAVARAGSLIGLGIDAEPHGPLPHGVLGSIARPEELDRLADLDARRPDVHWGRVLFSAKESVYKTWFPLAQCWLGFEDASLEFDLGPDGSDTDTSTSNETSTGTTSTGHFTARLLKPGLVLDGRPADQLTGRWLVCEDLVITAVSLAAAG